MYSMYAMIICLVSIRKARDRPELLLDINFMSEYFGKV